MCVKSIRLSQMSSVFSRKESEQATGLSGPRLILASC